MTDRSVWEEPDREPDREPEQDQERRNQPQQVSSDPGPAGASHASTAAENPPGLAEKKSLRRRTQPTGFSLGGGGGGAEFEFTNNRIGTQCAPCLRTSCSGHVTRPAG